jgi:hypothetical protein
MEEDEWRVTMLELLSRAHTLGGITDLSFATSKSHYAVGGVNFFPQAYTAAFDLGSCF